MNYFIAAILSTIFVGFGTFFRKIGITNKSAAFLYIALEGISFLLVGLIGLFLFGGEFVFSPIAFISGAFISTGIIFFLIASVSGPLSIVNTLLSANALITITLGIFVLREKISVIQAVGAFFILVGSVLLGL